MYTFTLSYTYTNIYDYSGRESKLSEECDRVSTKEKCTPNLGQDLNGTYIEKFTPKRKNNIKMNIIETGYEDTNGTHQIRNVKFRIRSTKGEFVTSWLSTSFSGRILFRGICLNAEKCQCMSTEVFMCVGWPTKPKAYFVVLTGIPISNCASQFVKQSNTLLPK